MKNKASIWRDIITSNGVAIQDEEFDRLNLYHDLLLDWNSRVNLVSRKDEHNIWPNHILHSVSLLFTLDIRLGLVAADIGSGGGLPALPLAILLPQVEVVMIESVKKKCIALSDMVSKLGLMNVSVVNARAEEVGRSVEHRNSVDIVFARAVASMGELISLSQPLVRTTSNLSIKARSQTVVPNDPIGLPCLVAMKGGNIVGEIEEAQRMSRHRSIVSYDITFDGIQETGLVEKKIVIAGL